MTKGSEVIAYKEKLEKIGFKLRKERWRGRRQPFNCKRLRYKDTNQLFSLSTGTRLHKKKCKLLPLS